MKIRRLICCTALLASASFIPARAQQLFPDLLTPSFRGDPGTEFTHWDIFSEAYAAPNYGDQAFAASDPTITQTLTSSAFLTSGFNIYSFAEATGFELANNVSSTLSSPLTNLVFQYDTLGTAIDFDSIRLHHSGGTLTLANANVFTEYRVITGGFGGFTNHTAIQWNLTGLGITGYTIIFESLGSSNSFNAAMLDTSINAYSEIVPSSRIWHNGVGDGKWGSAANWSGNTVTATGGNVTIGASAPAAIELDGSREVGQLTLAKSGTFNLTPGSGAVLTVNTGITSDGGNHAISAPIFMGGHNFMDMKAGATLIAHQGWSWHRDFFRGG